MEGRRSLSSKNNDFNPIAWAFLASFGLAALAFIVIGVGVAAIVVLPVGFGVWFFTKSGWAKENRFKSEIQELERRLGPTSHTLPSVDDFKWSVFEGVNERSQNRGRLRSTVAAEIVTVAQYIYKEQYETSSLSVPAAYTGIEGMRYAEHLRQQLALYAAGTPHEVVRAAMVDSFSSFVEYLPQYAFDNSGPSFFSIPLTAAVRSAGEAVERLILPFFPTDPWPAGLLSGFRAQLDANFRAQDETMPSQAGGPAQEVIDAYLQGTDLRFLFDLSLPIPIGDARFEHQWVIAPSGTGKTTLLQAQIVEDLERVQRGECSIIVIDSQNQLIPKIAGLKLFASGQPLEGRLTVIEPDPDYPPALNVLDIGLSELSSRDRYRMQAEALENVKSCLSTMADTQDDMLSYIVELCFVIPGATIQTIVDILKPNGIDNYRQYLDEVDQTCRDYFETSFTPRSQGTNVTKEALTRRLMGMLRNPTFRRMFLNERGKFNMAKELSEPRVILINTDLEFLRHDACQLFGRFFIAQLLQAAEMRGEESLPVFCYIDECQDYIANDDNAAKLMDKARKRKVAMIFAHQRLQNIESANVRDALANVGVRFAGGNETDANYLSKIFRCEPEFIANKTRGTFACFVRRQTQQAIEVRVPPNALESMPRMSEGEYAEIQAQMRARYAAPAEERPARPPPAAVPPFPPLEEPPAPRAPRTQRSRKPRADPDDRTTPEGNWEP
jgi:hypothetical protein